MQLKKNEKPKKLPSLSKYLLISGHKGWTQNRISFHFIDRLHFFDDEDEEKSVPKGKTKIN